MVNGGNDLVRSLTSESQPRAAPNSTYVVWTTAHNICSFEARKMSMSRFRTVQTSGAKF